MCTGVHYACVCAHTETQIDTYTGSTYMRVSTQQPVAAKYKTVCQWNDSKSKSWLVVYSCNRNELFCAAAVAFMNFCNKGVVFWKLCPNDSLEIKEIPYLIIKKKEEKERDKAIRRSGQKKLLFIFKN